jgi:hypothetical protein
MRPLALMALAAIVLGCGGETTVLDERPDLVVRATVDRSLVHTGQDFVYTVELDWGEGITPLIPEFGRKIEGLSITDEQMQGPDEIDGRPTQLFHYHLIANRAGSYELPGVEVSYVDAGGVGGSAVTEAILVEVSEPPPEGEATDGPPVQLDEQLRDIVQPRPIRDPNVALWLLITAVVFVLAAVVWIWMSRRRWAAPPPPMPPLPAHEQALLQLRELRDAGLLEDGHTQQFAYGLSNIFRTYLGQRFTFPAAEWTTTEIMQGLPEDLRSVRRDGDIRRVLDATDLVKYAGRPITAGEMEDLAGVCEGLVTETGSTIAADSEAP